MVTTVTINDELFAAAARAVNTVDPAEVIERALRLAATSGADFPTELYTPDRIVEFDRAEAELDEFLRQKGLRGSAA